LEDVTSTGTYVQSIILFVYLCDRNGYCGICCRKIRLRIKDETEREKAEIQAAHADRLQKLQQDFEQQLTDEKDKIRY